MAAAAAVSTRKNRRQCADRGTARRIARLARRGDTEKIPHCHPLSRFAGARGHRFAQPLAVAYRPQGNACRTAGLRAPRSRHGGRRGLSPAPRLLRRRSGRSSPLVSCGVVEPIWSTSRIESRRLRSALPLRRRVDRRRYIMFEFGSAIWKRSADKTIAVSLPVFLNQ